MQTSREKSTDPITPSQYQKGYEAPTHKTQICSDHARETSRAVAELNTTSARRYQKSYSAPLEHKIVLNPDAIRRSKMS